MESRRLFFTFFLILACSLPFALVEWKTPATDAVVGRVVTAGDMALFASYDGNVYAVTLAGGVPVWTYHAGSSMTLEPQLADLGTLAIATTDGRVTLLGVSDGKLHLEKDFGRPIRSMAVESNRIFLSFDDIVLAMDNAGKTIWNGSFKGDNGQLFAKNGLLYFTSGGKLYALVSSTGALKWSADAADTFQSSPAEYFGTVYLGGTDGRIYAFDRTAGVPKWSYPTGGWVMSTPTASSDAVFAGSNDGALYALSQAGRLRFKFQTGEAIWSSPELYQSQGRQLAVFSSNDGKVYAVDAETGEEKWSFSAYGKPGSISRIGSSFLFGTDKGIIYSLSPSPICSFTWPRSEEVVGSGPYDVEGSASSDEGIDGVEVRVAEGQWIAATGAESWYAPMNFSSVPEGMLTLECRARDRAGRTEVADFSSITLIKSESAPQQRMYVSSPREVDKNETFALFVRDERGRDIRDVKITVGGSGQLGNSPFGVILGRSGPVKITLEKPGFETAVTTVTGRGDGGLLLPIIVVALVLLASAVFLFRRRLMALFGK